MLLRTKVLIPLLLLAFALAPTTQEADAALPGSVTLSVIGAGSNAYFTVTGQVSWTWPTDFTASTWQLEYEFHGMDTSHSDIVARWIVPFTQNRTLLQSMPARSFDNRNRWANEDGDRWLRKRRDEIKVLVYIRRNGVRVSRGAVSNEVTGNF